MKEKRAFKRFDVFSILAAASILLALLFESFFIFELYETDLFAAVLSRSAVPAPVETKEEAAPAPAVEKSEPVDVEDVVPVG